MAELVNDEDHGGCLIPMMMICHEHDEDPEMRPEPISPEKREEIIVHIAAGVLGPYQFSVASTGQFQCPPERATAQCSQGRAERPGPVRLQEEVQAVLRGQVDY